MLALPPDWDYAFNMRQEHTNGEPSVRFRYFLDGVEVSEEECLAAEDAGTAKVTRGGSGVVPENLRQPNETRDDWINPWLEMRSI